MLQQVAYVLFMHQLIVAHLLTTNSKLPTYTYITLFVCAILCVVF